MLQLSSIIRRIGLILLLALQLSAFSQSYTVIASSGNAYIPLVTPNVIDICRDEALSDPIIDNIFMGFKFVFAGKEYWTIRVSSNGFLSFVWDGSNIDGLLPAVYIPIADTSLAFRTEPIIAPFWEDLTGDAESKALYSYSSEKFILEWQNWKWKNTRISFQVIFYKSTGIIEFCYKGIPANIENVKVGIQIPNGDFISPTNPTAVDGQKYQFIPVTLPGNKIQGLHFTMHKTEALEHAPKKYANILEGVWNTNINNNSETLLNPPGNGNNNCHTYKNNLGYYFEKNGCTNELPNKGYTSCLKGCNFNTFDYPSIIAIPIGGRYYNGQLTFCLTDFGVDWGYRFQQDIFYSNFAYSYAKDLKVNTYKAQLNGILESGSILGNMPHTRTLFKREEFGSISIDSENNKWFGGNFTYNTIKYNDNKWVRFNEKGIVSIENDGTKWIGDNYNFVEYSSPILYKSLNDEDFDLGHIATSGLPVTYTSTNSGVATIVDGKVHIVGLGSTTIETNQAGNAEFKPLPTFRQTLIVKQPNIIQFDSITIKTFGDADFMPVCSSSSGLPITYKCYDTTIATIVNGKIHITGSGTCNIYANQKGDDIYGPAKTVSRVLKVNESNQKIIFPNFPSDITYEYGDFDPGARASSGLEVSYSSDNKNIATIANGLIHITGVGSCKIYANQKGGGIYRPAETVSRVLIVNKAAQTIRFPHVIRRYGDVDVDTLATSSSGLPVTYSIPDEDVPILIAGKLQRPCDVATIVDGKIHIVGVGMCKIFANQAGSANYLPAEERYTIFTVDKFVPDFNSFSFEPYPNIQYQPLITIPLNCKIPPSSVLYQNPSIRYILQFKRSDGNVLEYSAPYSDTSITFPGVVGDYKVLVEIVFTNPNCQSSTFNLSTFNVSKANQTIAFNTLPEKTFGDPNFSLTATSTSGLAVTFTSSNPNVATVENGTVHIVGAGTCTITANQTGDSNYNPATEVSQTLTVNKANQTIDFGPIATKAYGDADFTLTSSSTSGLTIILSSSNPDVAIVENGIVHIVGTGTCTIYANQGGNNNYLAAPQVWQILSVYKAEQIIAFATIPLKTYGDSDFELETTTGNNLTISYFTDNPSVAKVQNSNIHITGAGTCNIYAYQSGNENYHPASMVSQQLTVAPKSINITATSNGKVYGEADPALTYQFDTNLLNGDNFTGTLSRTAGDNVGTYTIQQGTLSAGNNYSITYKEADFTITKKNLYIKADNKSKNYGEINPELTLSFDEFAYNDDKAVIDNLPTISCSATQNSISGIYPIELSGGSDNNYNLTLENGTLQVNTILGNVNTTSIQSITNSTAEVYGELTNHGGEESIIRGFVYGTSMNPTILNSKIEVGAGLGSFNQTINGLAPNAKYYIRSYATNSAGTAYGNELFFTTLSTSVPTTEGSEITIYPNPTDGILYFKDINPKSKVEIYNLKGALVQRVELVNNQINIMSLSAGTYIVKILSNDKINTIKVVKE